MKITVPVFMVSEARASATMHKLFGPKADKYFKAYKFLQLNLGKLTDKEKKDFQTFLLFVLGNPRSQPSALYDEIAAALFSKYKTLQCNFDIGTVVKQSVAQLYAGSDCTNLFNTLKAWAQPLSLDVEKTSHVAVIGYKVTTGGSGYLEVAYDLRQSLWHYHLKGKNGNSAATSSVYEPKAVKLLLSKVRLIKKQ